MRRLKGRQPLVLVAINVFGRGRIVPHINRYFGRGIDMP
jgi:ATP-dependent RNA helicase DDX3X